jgi:hypothetical protein
MFSYIKAVFENRVLGKISGRKRKEITGDGRQLHNEKLHDSYLLPNTIRVIKSRSLAWAGHVYHLGRKQTHAVFW